MTANPQLTEPPQRSGSISPKLKLLLRTGRVAAIAACCLQGLTPLPAADAASASRPNIVFLLTDNMGYGDPNCYGGGFAPTPNIDRLAREGVRFTQFYVASPICSASRAALLTGMYPGRWRITSYLQTRKGNRACEQADFLDPKAPSLARTLKAAGYATGHFGKWHMGGGRDVTNAPPFTPTALTNTPAPGKAPNPIRTLRPPTGSGPRRTRSNAGTAAPSS